MNRRRLVWVLVVALCLAAAGLALWLPRYAAAQRVSDLYRRYEHNPHLTVAYLEDFPLNDTVAVDVTTISAIDDEGWDTLCVDFEVPELPELILSVMGENEDFILSYKVSDDYKDVYKEIGICHDDVIAISYIKHIVSIFNTQDEIEKKAVLKYNIKQSIK
jgi:hypothetical protein